MRRSQPSSLRAKLSFLLSDRQGTIAALVAVSVLAGIMESGILTIVAQAASDLVAGTKRFHGTVASVHVSTTVNALLAIAFVLAVVRVGLMVPGSVLPAQIAADVQARLRSDLFNAFTRASWTAQSSDREGHLQELVTNQIAQATGAALQASQCLAAALSLAILVLSAFLLNAIGALVVLAAAVLLFVLLRPLIELGARQSRAMSQAQMDFASGVGEATRLAEETYVFGAVDAQQRRVARLLGSARDLFFKTQLLAIGVPNVYRGVLYVIIVAGLATLSLTHSGHVAALGGVVLLLVRAGGYGQAAQGSYQTIRQAMPYVERVDDATQRYLAAPAVNGERRIDGIRELAFRHVNFEYVAGRPVLADVSFVVAKGEAIGIVGPSGAGKSTIVQILLRLRPPTSGQYVVDGLPAEDVASLDWEAKVAYAPQEPRLLHASVRENICYFRHLSVDDVERAARLARIHDEIAAWPDGYDTVIGPRADAVSGGQRQRICIARALAGRPDILVLDEPTSALDPQSERLLQDSLRALKADLTLFVIAHRMATLELCDRVMVIVDGRLEAYGPPHSLRMLSPYYKLATELAERGEKVPL